MKQKKLAMLEDDNYDPGAFEEEEDDDDEFIFTGGDGDDSDEDAGGYEDTPSVKKKKKRKRKNTKGVVELREVVPLQEIIYKERMMEQPWWMANYLTAKASKSKLPARKFCSICGNQAIQRCIRCGQRYCCAKCQRVHKDLRCMKFMF
eukprot:TRINITY_DN6861_c0_g2_i1.p1 TRINITY_DN6861_c0_g2~~TRINITY_DN6861_c0_g2_i1.p1  ORF type:complete len:148 (+),score=53.20 TRINITY_DN6861_c0_g2_i1:126-569(+)